MVVALRAVAIRAAERLPPVTRGVVVGARYLMARFLALARFVSAR